MTAIDFIILVLLAAGLGRGFMVGAVRQVTSLIGVVLAFALAVQLMRPAGTMIVQSLGLAESLVPVLGFVAIFLVVQLVFYMLGHLAEQLLEALNISAVNRVLGCVLGGFKAALLLSVVFLLLARLNLPSAQTQRASMLYEPVARVLPQTWAFVKEYVPALKSLSQEFGDRMRAEVTTVSRRAPDVPPADN